jgi:hypothetical protein
MGDSVIDLACFIERLIVPLPLNSHFREGRVNVIVYASSHASHTLLTELIQKWLELLSLPEPSSQDLESLLDLILVLTEIVSND